jgi:hypothetical protein
VLQARERTPTPYPSTIFTFRLAIESIKEFGGVSINDVVSTINIRIAHIFMDIKVKTFKQMYHKHIFFGESLVLPLPIFPRVGYCPCICIWKQQGGELVKHMVTSLNTIAACRNKKL